ncbi:MAG: TOBE domain-containing protein [Pyrinomonadaceae bacterium]|nr:TOBE domain-containing protein [Pyrinomonadaceae bacterium]
MLNELQTAKQNGSTAIFASNDFEQIAAVCDRVAVLVKGEVAQIGFPQEVYENPASSAVAAIVGRNNLFTARRLTSTNADLPEFQTIEGSHRIVAQPTEKAALGAINQNVTLAIRPEQVSISFEASFPEDNILKAVVTAIRFLGPTTIIELDANGLRLESRVFRIVGLTVGEQCMIAMPPHRIQVLKN